MSTVMLALGDIAAEWRRAVLCSAETAPNIDTVRWAPNTVADAVGADDAAAAGGAADVGDGVGTDAGRRTRSGLLRCTGCGDCGSVEAGQSAMTKAPAAGEGPPAPGGWAVVAVDEVFAALVSVAAAGATVPWVVGDGTTSELTGSPAGATLTAAR